MNILWVSPFLPSHDAPHAGGRAVAQWIAAAAARHSVTLLTRVEPPERGAAEALRASLAAVHVQFPDPWWKKRHNKRRMVDVELAARMRLLLRAGGEVDFRTDVRAYAEAAVATWEEAGFANAAGPGSLWDEAPEVLSTRERRYARSRQPVYRARFVNPGPPGAEPRVGTARTGREWTDVRRK